MNFDLTHVFMRFMFSEVGRDCLCSMRWSGLYRGCVCPQELGRFYLHVMRYLNLAKQCRKANEKIRGRAVTERPICYLHAVFEANKAFNHLCTD